MFFENLSYVVDRRIQIVTLENPVLVSIVIQKALSINWWKTGPMLENSDLPVPIKE